MREDFRREPESDLDHQLSAKYGAYASFITPDDPTRVDYFGDSPATEFDRLLDAYARPNAHFLDLGCGAGFTMSRIAPMVASITGVDLEMDLISGAQARLNARSITNAKLIYGDSTHQEVVDQLSDLHFDVALSRRGPFITEALAQKLTPNAVFIVELAQDFLGLKEMFGRYPVAPKSSGDPDFAISAQSGAGFVPVSAKTYWYHEYFRDADHLAAYLRHGAPLQNWWMSPCPYEEPRDRPALDLWCRYNQDENGVRLVGQRKIYVFRRQPTNYYPATL